MNKICNFTSEGRKLQKGEEAEYIDPKLEDEF